LGPGFLFSIAQNAFLVFKITLFTILSGSIAIVPSVLNNQREAVKLGNEDILTIPELFPGWELAVVELWPPVFDDIETDNY
jgi:Uma2 family endonuclease